MLRNAADTIEDGIQKGNLTAVHNITTTSIESAVRSSNASSERDTVDIIAYSEREEQVRFTASFEKVSNRNGTFLELNPLDDIRGYKLGEVS